MRADVIERSKDYTAEHACTRRLSLLILTDHATSPTSVLTKQTKPPLGSSIPAWQHLDHMACRSRSLSCPP